MESPRSAPTMEAEVTVTRTLLVLVNVIVAAALVGADGRVPDAHAGWPGGHHAASGKCHRLSSGGGILSCDHTLAALAHPVADRHRTCRKASGARYSPRRRGTRGSGGGADRGEEGPERSGHVHAVQALDEQSGGV